MLVLLTGFEPFGDSNINSSWETAVRVGQMSPNGVTIEVKKLPVSFKRAGDDIREILTDLRPDALIMLGQRGNGQSVDIERIAVNLMDSANPDNDGYCPQEQRIADDGDSAYFSNIPVKILRDALMSRGIPAKVSNSAGLYVCNSTYYNALNEIYEQHLQTKVVFVHLPKLDDKFTVDILADSVQAIIENCINTTKR